MNDNDKKFERILADIDAADGDPHYVGEDYRGRAPYGTPVPPLETRRYFEAIIGVLLAAALFFGAVYLIAVAAGYGA